MNDLKLDIKFPIQKAYKSDNYALIIIDFIGIYHYFNEDGSYDGYSHNPEIDGKSKTNMN